MKDSTQFSPEDNATSSKSKLPLVLLIVALLLGLVIWRFKSGGKSTESVMPPPQDTISKIEPTPQPVMPETTVAAPTRKVKPKKPLTGGEPRIVGSERQGDLRIVRAPKPEKDEPKVVSVPTQKAETSKKVEASKPSIHKESVASSTPMQPETKAPVAAPTQPEPKAPSGVPKPVEPPSMAQSKPPIDVDQSGKKIALEDQPLSENVPLSDEGRLATNTLPKAAETPSEAVAASPEASDAFKQGMQAYQKKDYAAAIQIFGKLPKPSTKQRGNPARDQYVEGNFLMGLSLLQTDRTKDAVSAFLTVLNYEKYYPLANMNLGICYVELRQYFKASKTFEAVIRDQGYIDAAVYDDVMQRSKYFWALAWTRMYKTSKEPNKQAYYLHQAILRWKDYQAWYGKNTKFRAENRRADEYIKSLSGM